MASPPPAAPGGLNPNEVVSEAWTTAQGGIIQANNNDPTYGKITTYRDGHTTLTVYKRGSGNPSQGVPDQQVGDPQPFGIDPDAAKKWKDDVAAAVPPGSRPSIPSNGHMWGYDPKTQTYSIDEGPITAAPRPIEPGQVQGVPNDPTIQTQQPDGTWKTTPNPGYVPPAGAAGTIHEIPGQGVFIVKADGTTIKTNLPATPKPSSSTTVKGEDGKTYVVTVDAQGNVTTKDTGIGPAATTPVPASATGWQPDMSKPDVGIFDRRTAVAKMLADGVFGDPTSAAAQQKANDLLKQDLDFAGTVIKNIESIQGGEQGIYSGQISQRGQDITQADTRTQAATSIFNNALGQIAQLLPFAKQHSKAAGPALEALLQKGYEFQQKMGGQNTPAQVQPGPYMSRTAPIFQPNSNPLAPMAFPTPATAPAAAPQAAAAPGAPIPFVPPPTGAPRTAPATQGPYAPPAAPPQLTIPPPPPLSEQTRDTTGPGYPGQMPAPSYTPPAQTLDPNGTGPQPGDFPATPMPAGFQQLQQQGPLGGGNVLGWGQSLGFDPSVLAAFAQSRGLGG